MNPKQRLFFCLALSLLAAGALAQNTRIVPVDARVKVFEESVQEFTKIVQGWESKAEWQLYLSIFGAGIGMAIAIIQTFKEVWSRRTVQILGGVVAFITLITTQVLTDHRVLNSSAVEGRREIDQLKVDLAALHDSPENFDQLKPALLQTTREFHSLHKAVVGGGISANINSPPLLLKFSLVPRVYADSKNTCGYSEGADRYGRYFVGAADDASFTKAGELALDNAVNRALDLFAIKEKVRNEVQQTLREAAVVEHKKYGYKSGHFHFCMQIRIGKEAERLVGASEHK